MKKTLSIIGSRSKISIVILLIVISIVTVATALSCIYPEDKNIKNDFYNSIKYNPSKGLLSFTIPKTIPEGYKFYLHVSGRIFMGDKSNGMSFHAFDEESQNYTWQKGKTYTYNLKSDNLDFILLDFGLIGEKNKLFLYEYAVKVSPNGAKTISDVQKTEKSSRGD